MVKRNTIVDVNFEGQQTIFSNRLVVVANKRVNGEPQTIITTTRHLESTLPPPTTYVLIYLYKNRGSTCERRALLTFTSSFSSGARLSTRR